MATTTRQIHVPRVPLYYFALTLIPIVSVLLLKYFGLMAVARLGVIALIAAALALGVLARPRFGVYFMMVYIFAGLSLYAPGPAAAAIIDSTLEGVSKPDPAIFTPAIDALGFEPASVLYVGDTVHADVVGATNANMQAVQLDPFDQHHDFDHARLPDLSALEAVLAR